MGEKQPPLPCVIHSRMGQVGWRQEVRMGTGCMHVQISPGDSGVLLSPMPF